MVFNFGNILFCVLYALAPELVKLVDGFTGSGFRPARNAVSGVFIGRTLRGIKAVIRFVFGADISRFHTLGGNRRFINRFDRSFRNLPCLYLRHNYASFPSRDNSPRKAE